MPMSAVSYVKRRQRAWAIARGIPFDENLLVDHLEHNLFEPPGAPGPNGIPGGRRSRVGGPGSPRPHVLAEVVLGGGRQSLPLLADTRVPGTHPSGLQNPPSRGFKSASRGATPDRPSARGPGAIPPNLDVEIRGEDGGVTAFECKLTEPFCSGRGGLGPRYLRDDLAHVWDGLPNLHALAQVVSPKDDRFVHLHAAQLVKHVLGLKAGCGKDAFRLVYLWCDVAGRESVEHARELEEFARIAAADGIEFRSLTYQEVILGLAERHRPGNEGYVDYMVGRYL